MTIDWSKAPEGAKWYMSGYPEWYKGAEGRMQFFESGAWFESRFTSIDDIKSQHPSEVVTPRPSEPKPYTRDEALQFLVERLDSWPTDIADAPLCPGWGWHFEEGLSYPRFISRLLAQPLYLSQGGDITRKAWLDARPDFVPFVSLEDAQPATGQKFDTGKPLIGAIPPHAELAVARVMTFGAQKYARDNWRKIDDIPTRYMDAALRHLNAVRRGDTVDPESGEHHLAHAACCILFMLDVVEASDAQTDR